MTDTLSPREPPTTQPSAVEGMPAGGEAAAGMAKMNSGWSGEISVVSGGYCASAPSAAGKENAAISAAMIGR